MTKIIFGINVPYQTTEIDWEATDKLRIEKKLIAFGDWVRVPCIRYKTLSFELCEYCGNQITGGRAKRGWKSCSPECNKKLNGAWAHHTYEKEKVAKGIRPIFFWWKIRDECFERDNYKCQTCGVDITEYLKKGIKPPEAHHIIQIKDGGSNELSNLKTVCYDCHKKEHSRSMKIRKLHKPLEV